MFRLVRLQRHDRVPGRGGSNTTQPSGNFYLVVDNDYWAGIAKKLGVTVEALLAANNATSSTVIHRVSGSRFLADPAVPGV